MTTPFVGFAATVSLVSGVALVGFVRRARRFRVAMFVGFGSEHSLVSCCASPCGWSAIAKDAGKDGQFGQGAELVRQCGSEEAGTLTEIVDRVRLAPNC